MRVHNALLRLKAGGVPAKGGRVPKIEKRRVLVIVSPAKDVYFQLCLKS